MKKIKLNKHFLSELHELIYQNSNTLIGLEINRKCRAFIKELEKCDYESNNH